MAEYYLISQLPSLDAISETAPLPITVERFMELCECSLSNKIMCKLKKLTIGPPVNFESSGNYFVDEWNACERDLRLALGKARANKLNKPFALQNATVNSELCNVVNAAVELTDPLEAEIFLLRYRLHFLENLRPLNAFSEHFLFYYALKLKLLSRIRQFDTEFGKVTYKNIYSSIMYGDSLET